MGGFQNPTQEELKQKYIEMLLIFGESESTEEGHRKLESYILRMGRLEMHHMIAYLFWRSVKEGLDNTKLKEEIDALNSRLNSTDESDQRDR